MLIGLFSLKSSPGVSTTALALSAAWPGDGQRPLVIEADRRGGDASLRFGTPSGTGLKSLAAASRANPDVGLVRAHAHLVPPAGVPVVTAPELAEHADPAVWGVLPLLERLANTADPVLLDLGEAYPADPETARLLQLCGRLLMVARPVADQIGRIRASGWVRDARFGVELVLIGAADVAEMATLTGLGVAGVLPLLPADKSPAARLSAGMGVRRFNAAAASLARSLAQSSTGNDATAGAAA
jgi:hypothetical protein